MKLAQDGAYAGTTFHRAVRMGIVQGGDPLSKDPAKSVAVRDGRPRRAEGGVQRDADGPRRGRRGAAAGQAGQRRRAVLHRGHRSARAERAVHRLRAVVDGLEVVQQISEAPVDAQGRVTERIEITKVTIRDAPPPDAVPFAYETRRRSWRRTAPFSTPQAGDITIAFRPDKAPEHVRNFLRLAQPASTTGRPSIASSRAS